MVKHLADDEYGDVVLSDIREYGIGNTSDLAALDLQSRLLQCLSLGTLHEVFAVLKMSTWECPLSLINVSKVSEMIVPSSEIRCARGGELLKSFVRGDFGICGSCG